MRRKLMLLGIVTVLASVSAPGCGGGDGGGQPPNIIVLVVDSLRADHLASYGYDRDTSPYLDALAARGVLFERAYTQASQTRLSVASLVTGLNPPSHHVREAGAASAGDSAVVADVLSEELDTLAERLKAAGYATAGFVTNPHLEPGQGFDQGFDHYTYTDFRHCLADRLNESVLAWIGLERSEPWFAYVHYMDVHMPYRPPIEYQYYSGENAMLKPVEANGPPNTLVNMERITRTVNMYDGQINYWDDRLAELVAGLPGGESLENTILVVVSDHGDEFFEHGGFGHGYTVYDGVIHVPLVVVGAVGQEAGLRRSDPARLVDLLPTLCKLAGAPADESLLEGSDLFAAGRADGIAGLEVYAEAVFGARPRSVRKNGGFLVFNETGQDWEFYDLNLDPFEQIDIWAQRSDGLDGLRTDLARLQAGRGLIAKPEPAVLDDEAVETLKSLGY
ncbi:MAG: sulfatase [bacterium]|nr:sulfatase [bacterium]